MFYLLENVKDRVVQCTLNLTTSPVEMILIFEMVENMSSQPLPDGTAVSLEDV